MKILITAGPTREYIDSVRFISNGSSGRTGCLIAHEAAKAGHEVTLVCGPVSVGLPKHRRVCVVPVVSAEEMYRACVRAFADVDAVIMTAAVSDYRPKHRSRTKIKKSDGDETLELERTRDILAELGRRKRNSQVLVGFALEDRSARSAAADKFHRKHLDAILLNGPAALASERNAVHVFDGCEWHAWPEMSKKKLAKHVVTLTQGLCDAVRSVCAEGASKKRRRARRGAER